MTIVFNTLAPIILIILLGWRLSKAKVLSETFFEELQSFIFWWAMPALIINALVKSAGIPDETLAALLAFSCSTLGMIGLCIVLNKVLKVLPEQRGVFIQGSFRGNLAFVAVPILQFALRDLPEDQQSHALALTIFIFAPIMVLYNVASVLALVFGNTKEHSNKTQAVVDSALSILKNPLILSSGVGVILFFLPIKIPVAITNSLSYFGQMAGPAALLCVGHGMAHSSLRGNAKLATLSAFLKVCICPLLTWLISTWMGLDEHSSFVLLIMSTSPAAVAGYIMAKAMKGDAALASTNIFLSTLLSAISFSIILLSNSF
jgi:predicted permease